MLVEFSDRTPFCIGGIEYDYAPASVRENTPRIILPVEIEGIRTTAFVDTGGIHLICSPDIAASAGLNPAGGIQTFQLQWRGTRLQGILHRVSLTLLASIGMSVNIDATAFVPQLADGWIENFPCILGMYGCLERLRFAVDPNSDTFYFGPLSEP